MQKGIYVDSFESGSTPNGIWFMDKDECDEEDIYVIDDELWASFQAALAVATEVKAAIFSQLQAQGCPHLGGVGGWGPPAVLIR